jgi:hypothetical protein
MTASAAITRIRLFQACFEMAGCGARATVLRLVTYDLELTRGWDVVAAQQGACSWKQLETRTARGEHPPMRKLAEEPGNLDFREQYLHLARAWMDLALEEALPQE